LRLAESNRGGPHQRWKNQENLFEETVTVFQSKPHTGKAQIERYARFPARSSRIDLVESKEQLFSTVVRPIQLLV